MRLRRIALAVMTCALFLATAIPSRAQSATTFNTNVDDQQVDKVLFGRAMWSMEKSKYVEARALLESLIEGHPDSDYVPIAKLAIGDAWYAEGSFENAKLEYQDFVTFFPNRPEVAEVQRKITAMQTK